MHILVALNGLCGFKTEDMEFEGTHGEELGVNTTKLRFKTNEILKE